MPKMRSSAAPDDRSPVYNDLHRLRLGNAMRVTTKLKGALDSAIDDLIRGPVKRLEVAQSFVNINQAIQQLDQVTQQNAAAPEQISATAETLADQAEELQQAIAFFRFGGLNPLRSAVTHRARVAEPRRRAVKAPCGGAEQTQVGHGVRPAGARTRLRARPQYRWSRSRGRRIHPVGVIGPGRGRRRIMPPSPAGRVIVTA
jgi:hypothetical protein